MDINGDEVLQLLVSNFKLKDIIKEEFLEDITSQCDENVRVVGVNFVIGENSADVVTLTHLIPDYEKNNKVVVDVRNPKHVDIMVNAIKSSE